MNILLEMFGNAVIVLVLVFLVYWIMDWVKKFLGQFEKLPSIYFQPIALLVGTGLASLVMANYNFRPLELGTPSLLWIDFILQGSVLAALAGILYDKFFEELTLG